MLTPAARRELKGRAVPGDAASIAALDGKLACAVVAQLASFFGVSGVAFAIWPASSLQSVLWRLLLCSCIVLPIGLAINRYYASIQGQIDDRLIAAFPDSCRICGADLGPASSADCSMCVGCTNPS